MFGFGGKKQNPTTPATSQAPNTTIPNKQVNPTQNNLTDTYNK
jgi:hypothetical protein